MIVKLHGVVEEIFNDRLVLNINGVCYEVLCSTKTIEAAAVGGEVILWTAHIIREDAQLLCGFLSYDEKLWFREIIGVRGLGPKAALSILSALSISDLVSAILNQDSDVLTQAGGVGKKGAERIIAELKNSKLLKNENFAPSESNRIQSGLEHDVIEALTTLGYDRTEARNAIMNVGSRNFSSTEELLKATLSSITRK
ncbi:MAG: Holliday junction branch migration protein RuvA [Holosporales bacterium]|jgi:Holliday junction DNA helicase RuvA|nr:Holliday junction branch migration protein RuvA [Holosporales bacterium]